ncbi:U2 snRNP-associated SURP motif-containing protein, putative [Babesia caballi]|uniref:U2 snRNP-associated SURP motif-containing protein, putative n=1 Tax=Babesia caballi TaxID=5871 RepID=A0AAV4LLM8_BABCB|nr:U2 snRNP-associated SURP motif-containing protein, putative [Babesia caballi]
MLPAWHQWNAYPPEYLCGLESALWGADFDSFTALPIFEENLDALDPTYDGDEIEHYDVLCKFPLRWREAAYRYLQMRLKKLRQLCVSRGLVTDPGTRSALVTRLIINDMYVEARAMEARDNSSESTHVEPDEMEAALSDPTQYVEESATLAGNPLHATDATGSSYTIQAVAGDVVYDECSDMESESDREAADLKEVPVEVEAVAAESCEKAIEAVAVTVSEVEDADAGTVEVMSVSDVAADASPPPSEPEVVTEEDDIEDMFAAENYGVEKVRRAAPAAVRAVVVRGHEHTASASARRALLEQPDNLVALQLVVLEHRELDLLLLVLDLLRGGVLLLLALLTTTAHVNVLHKVGGLVVTDEISDERRVLGLGQPGPERLDAVFESVLSRDAVLEFRDGFGARDVDDGGATVEELDKNLSGLHVGLGRTAQSGLRSAILSKPKTERVSEGVPTELRVAGKSSPREPVVLGRVSIRGQNATEMELSSFPLRPPTACFFGLRFI